MKYQKINILLIITTLCLLPSTIFAEEVEIDGIKYSLVKKIKEATVISKETMYTGDVDIPATVEYEDLEFSVTTIGDKAFYGCWVTSVTIPNSVTSIGEYAFCSCTEIPSIIIPNSVICIGNNAFMYCTSLSTVNIPNSVTCIGNSAFYGCTNLNSITIPNSVSSIYNSTFEGCTSLTAVTIPNSVKTIEYRAFYNCKGLTSITIPNSVTNIGNNAFYNCSGLTYVTIGNGIKSINNNAFANCRNIETFTINSTSVPITKSDVFDNSYIEYATLIVPDESIKLYIQNTPWKSFGKIIGLNNSYFIIVDDIYYILNPKDNTAEVISNPNKYSGNIIIPTIIEYEDIDYCVTRIGDKSFQFCDYLTAVTIPNSVTNIGVHAFSWCSSLTAVTIPNSVINIGDHAFFGCSSLTAVTIPNSVTKIGSEAFENCLALTSVDISDIAAWCNIFFYDSASNPLSYAENLYLNGEKVTHLSIPSIVKSIGQYSFINCSELTSVTIPNSVMSIGKGAFHNCTNLTSVNISNIAAWCNISFVNAESNPLTYAHNLYLNNVIISKITIPENVTSVGNYTFYNCTSLVSVTIPDNVKEIGKYAFSRCTNLSSINIPNNVTSIGNGAFENCKGLTSIIIPNSVTTIGDYAFYNCDGVISFYVGNGIQYIGMMAFSGCYNLKYFTICATSVPWSNILDGHAFSGSGFDNATLFVPEESVELYSNSFPWSEFGTITVIGSIKFEYAIISTDDKTISFYYDGNRWSRDGKIYDLQNSFEPGWLEKASSITKAVFDPSFAFNNPVTTNQWFCGMKNLSNIEGMEYLNTSKVTDMYCMFYECSSLTSLDLSSFDTSNVIDMGGMFCGCSSLTSLDLSSFDTSNALHMDGMFYECSSLTSLDLSSFDTSNVKYMYCMFNGCSSLTSLDLSSFDTSNVKYMYCMFNGCSSLTSLDLRSFDTSNVIDMGSKDEADVGGMFSGCSSLKSLDLSSFNTSNVTNMNSMFKGCSSLESIDLSHFTIGENTQTAEMMSGCFALKRLLISSTMNRLEPDACLGVGTTTSPCEIKAPSGFDFGVSTSGDYFRWKGGCFAITSEEYAVVSSGGTTITFYCDGSRSSRSGTTYDLQTSGKPDWSSQAATITKAVIDPSFSFARPVTVRSWFEGMKNLKAIEGIENLNTSEAEYTSYMFQHCSSLESLDLSHFDTHKVKMMGAMFKGCSSLKSVDISNFDSGICTSLNSMFYGCSKLTSLDLSALTINESADSRSMLNSCTALEELTIPESAGNLNSTAFTTVGTSYAPCIIHAPEGFDFGTDTGNAFQWKGGWFVLHTPATITASVASLSPGNAAQLIVRMNNSAVSSYNGFEMVFCLPEGMSIAKKGNDFDCKLGGRCSGMSVSVSDLGNGIYRIMGYSLSNATISGTEGALFLLSISCPENVSVGSYTGTLEDISLSTTAGTGEEPDDVTFPITVSQYRMGDVDLNGKINVIDVMLVVSHILGDKLNNFHAEYADMDGNEKINVLDVTTIIDVILNSPYMSQQAPERLSHTTHLTQLPASGGVVLALDGTERFTACQMDVRIEGGVMLRGVKLLGGNASSHSVKYSRISDDMWRIVVYSAKGAALENGAPLLQLLTDGKGNAIIENIEMCSELFESVTPECIEGSATAITEAGTDIQEVLTYTIQGIRIAKPQRGVNIRKGAKVTVK